MTLALVAPPQPDPPHPIVEQTWEEVGCRVRMRNLYVMVRTEPVAQKVGLLWLPPKLQTFFGELPHKQMIVGRVLSVGDRVKGVSPGDQICFARLHFAWWKRLRDGNYVGWVPAYQVAGHYEE